MKTYPQFSVFVCHTACKLIPRQGRATSVKVGDRLVNTNSQGGQAGSGAYQLARERGAKVGQGWFVEESDLPKHFTPVER